MWISREQKREQTTTFAGDTGSVTLNDKELGVYLDSERRGVAHYAPGGYRWRPGIGEKVLVMKSGEGACVVGVETDGSGLAAGEVELESGGGAGILLDNQGAITLRGQVNIDGALFFKGTELSDFVTSLVRSIMNNS